MAYIDHVRSEYEQAVEEWRGYARTGAIPLHVERRRNAATRSLHYLEDLSGSCNCAICRMPVV